jgi:hypothetical protein
MARTANSVNRPTKPAFSRAAEPEPASDLPDLDQEFEQMEAESVDGYDADSEGDLNNPDIVHLGDAPMVGGRSRVSDLFGESADFVAGRVTSPKLYAQAAQFPTCAQLRVWKWENGIPVGLGTIDSAATEEDMVRLFYSAMPKKGEGRAQFKLRPIDIRGQELGQEVTLVISEHHAAIRAIKEAEAEENERASNPYAFMQQQQSGGEMSGELSRMVEHMLATAESRSKQLEESLEMERDRIRQEELRRTQERVDLATNAAQGVQAITERMMRDEAARAERANKSQTEQSQMLITTLTSIFSQQQSMAAQAAEAARRSDEYRIEQERQRAERERVAAEDRRKLELQEAEFRRQREREEAEYRLRLEREETERKRQEYDRILVQQKAELEVRLQREREEMENRRREYDLKMQREREETQMRAAEAERKLSMEREEAQRRFDQARLELELKLNREREEMERKERREREEAERREKWFAEERARRESREAQEGRERDAERQRQHDRMIKELEIKAQQDREHAERMASLSKAEASASSGDVLSSAAKLFGQFGVPPNEIFKRLFATQESVEDDGDEGKASPWMEALPKIFSVVGDVAKAAAAGRGPAPGQGMDPRSVPTEYYQQAQAQAQAHAQAQAQAQSRQPTRMLPANVPEQFAQPRQRQPVMRRVVESDMMATVDQAVQLAPTPEPEPEPVTEMAPVSEPLMEIQSEPAPQSVAPQQDGPIVLSLSDLAASKNIPLKSQKSARKGIRALVKQLEKDPNEAEWENVIGVAVATEPSIYHYVDAVTVKAAMLEAGASEEFTDRIVAAMRRSPLVPENFNYGDNA